MSVFVEQEKGKMVELYRGCVLGSRERNYYDDSDWYAVVWDKHEGRIESYDYATTRFGGTDRNHVTVDITPDNLEALRGWSFLANLKGVALADWAQANTPAKGRRVRVVSKRMRRVAHGTEGVVFWTGKCRAYGSPYSPRYDDRLGFKTDTGETIWAGFDQVEVIDPEQYQHDLAELASAARDMTRTRGWLSHVAVAPGLIRV